jgi:pyruvate dehydrogenase E1 component beta subunit
MTWSFIQKRIKMAIMNMVQALNLAMKQEMKRDNNVVVMGEDVGVDGGVFRVTDGLITEFGSERVMDTPLAESGIVGTALGMALYGLRPIAEIQFDGFTYPAFDQIISHISRYRNRTRGRLTAPLVIRAPWGGGVRALEHHSETPEAYYAHIPGLKVIIPSTPYDAKGLLASAIRDPDPVLFFEPKKLYRAVKQEVPEKEYTIQIGKANVVQQGKDLTIITYGSHVRTTIQALELLEGKYSVEVIDLRTISPLDYETIINSVQKTGRAMVVHEAARSFGVGAEIVAQINEKAFLSLQAPVERVTGFDIVVPLPKMEDYYHVSKERILKGIEKVMSF